MMLVICLVKGKNYVMDNNGNNNINHNESEDSN